MDENEWGWDLGKFSKHPILVPKQYLLFCDQHAKILHHISEVYQHFWDLNRHLIYAICNVLVSKNSKISAAICQLPNFRINYLKWIWGENFSLN